MAPGFRVPYSLNSLKLPQHFRVRAFFKDELSPAPAILVGLDFLVDGQYYFGTLIGLTDADGITSTSAHEVQATFLEEQRAFPMDYRLSLHDCDPAVRIVIEGGPAFTRRRADALASPVITRRFRGFWEQAHNAQIEPVSVLVPLEGPAGLVSVPITVALAP
jgi:hypothetical protein